MNPSLENKSIPSVDIHLSEDLLDEIKAKEVTELSKFEVDTSISIYWKHFVSLTVSIIAIFILFFGFSLHQSIENILPISIEMKVRDLVGKTPPLDARIKTIVYDDGVFNRLKQADLSITQWSKLLAKLNLMQPKAILIDKIFGIVPDLDNELQKTTRFLNSIKTPVYSGAIVSPRKLPARKSLQETTLKSGKKEIADSLLGPLVDARNQYAYGPIEFLQRYFDPGHILYYNSRAFQVGFRIAGDSFLPHLGLMVADQISIAQEKDLLLVNNTELSPKNGVLPLNFISPQRLMQSTLPLDKVLKASKKSLQEMFSPGDVVVILPAFYTGSGDFRYSPYGIVNGGFFVLSVVNSVLTNSWLNSFKGDVILTGLAILLGASIVFLLPPMYLLFGLLIPFFLFAGGMLLFVYGATISLWPIWCFAYVVTFLASIVYKRFVDRKIEEQQNALISNAKVTVRENLLLEAKKATLLKEKQDAAKIAASLLPDDDPQDWKPFKVTSFHRCFDAASGDWYFFYHDPNSDFYHIGMLDIVGHGVQAAIIVSSCKALLAGVKENCPDWGNSKDFHVKMVSHLNQVLYNQARGSHQTTYCGLTMERGQQTIQILAAGHPFPYVLDCEKQKLRRIKNANTPPGLSLRAVYESKEIVLAQNEKLLIFSDGLPILEHSRAFKKYLSQLSYDFRDAEEVSVGFEKFLQEHYQVVTEDDVSVVLLEFQE